MLKINFYQRKKIFFVKFEKISNFLLVNKSATWILIIISSRFWSLKKFWKIVFFLKNLRKKRKIISENWKFWIIYFRFKMELWWKFYHFRLLGAKNGSKVIFSENAFFGYKSENFDISLRRKIPFSIVNGLINNEFRTLIHEPGIAI